MHVVQLAKASLREEGWLSGINRNWKRGKVASFLDSLHLVPNRSLLFSDYCVVSDRVRMTGGWRVVI